MRLLLIAVLAISISSCAHQIPAPEETPPVASIPPSPEQSEIFAPKEVAKPVPKPKVLPKKKHKKHKKHKKNKKDQDQK